MNRLAKLTTMSATTRKVWHLAAPFFSSEQKWKARGMLVAQQLDNGLAGPQGELVAPAVGGRRRRRPELRARRPARRR